MSRAGEPIVAAYVGALLNSCENCGAPAGEWCRDRHGRNLRVPCVKRLALAPVLVDELGSGGVDFAEPRHRAEVD